MKHFLKKSALAAAMLACLGSAQAAVITFDEPVTSPFALDAPLFGHLDEFYQGSFFIDTYSNSPDRIAGDLVAGLKDSTDSAGICAGVICPTLGATGNYLTVVNDGFLAIGSTDAAAPLVSLSSFSAGFVGVAGDTYSSTRSGRVIIVGVRTDGSATSVAGNLSLPDATGAFSFSNFTVPAAFAAEQFAYLQIYGAYCPSGSTSCSSFTTNKAQFALDNLNITAVPEPGTWGLMGLGLAGIAAISRRRRAV